MVWWVCPEGPRCGRVEAPGESLNVKAGAWVFPWLIGLTVIPALPSSEVEG